MTLEKKNYSTCWYPQAIYFDLKVSHPGKSSSLRFQGKVLVEKT